MKQRRGEEQRGVSTCLVQAHDVIPQVGASRGGHDLHPAQVLTDLDADLAHLQGQLTRGHQHHSCGGGGYQRLKTELFSFISKKYQSRKENDGRYACSHYAILTLDFTPADISLNYMKIGNDPP